MRRLWPKLSWRGAPPPPEHEHDFKAIGAQAAVRQPLQPARTLVLYLCECGEVRSTELQGNWTLDQITGYNSGGPING